MGLYERLLERSRRPPSERPPRPSASVVPWRRTGDGLEVFWVRRSPELAFMGGWHAFPGGGLSRSDATATLAEPPRGTAEGTVSPAEPPGGEEGRRLDPDLVPGLAACALRELFEETGLVLARDLLVAEPRPELLERLRRARRRHLRGELSFTELVAGEGLTLTASPLVFAGRWLTPPLAPRRFDNRFFLLEWPRERHQQPEIVRGELVEGEWIAPADALGRWRRGEVLAAPPILHVLRVLAEDGPEAGLPRLRDPRETCLGPFRRIEFRPGVVMLPLRTPTLPPATHTNAFLLGYGEAVLVDPAPPFEAEIGRLLEALHAARAGGVEIREIWLTHHHRDHTGAVEAVRRELDLRVYAHRLSAAPLEAQGIRLDGELSDGEVRRLDGDPPMEVRALHTPGHTRGHLAFYEPEGGSLLAGDLVSSLSTVVIDPPEGDMDEYLASLESLIALGPRTLFPAHGPPISRPLEKLRELRRHRLEREREVLAAWNAGRRSARQMVAEVYAEVPEALHPVAERQIEAHLERLRRRGAI